jgi:hypothetical protein
MRATEQNKNKQPMHVRALAFVGGRGVLCCLLHGGRLAGFGAQAASGAPRAFHIVYGGGQGSGRANPPRLASARWSLNRWLSVHPIGKIAAAVECHRP